MFLLCQWIYILNQFLDKLKSYATSYYKLGDRVLKVGMSGTDVAEMKNYLIDKGYLQGTAVKGVILFDTTIESALKQEKVNLMKIFLIS